MWSTFAILFFNFIFFLRWMDGAFLELNGEVMEAEIDDFSREIYKMSKLFQQKQKKIQQELKKTQRRTVEEKKGEEIKANPTLTMCSSVLEQIKGFKVKIKWQGLLIFNAKEQILN